MNTRKDFLVATSLFAMAPAAADAALENEYIAAAGTELTFTFDRAAFRRILSKHARHKQCFGATKLQHGEVLQAMANSMDAYEQYLKEGPGALQAVAVLYHGASIAMAFSNKVWNDVLIPSLKSMPDDMRGDVGAVKPGGGNPFISKFGKITGRGASFFVCHNAIAGVAQMVSGALKRPAQQVHDELMAGILPGALAVPAGVMAVNACQEAHFTYIQSTL